MHPHQRHKAAPRDRSWKTIGKTVLDDIKGDDVPGLAAEIAYHAIFAIPPAIIFVVTMAAVVNEFTGVPVAERLTEAINESAPGETRELLQSMVDKAIAQVSGGLVSVGVIFAALLALWSGSNGIATLIKAFNRAYEVEEERPFVKKKIVSIGLTVLVAVLINLAFVLFVFGGSIGQWAADQLGLSDAFTTTWQILRWPLGLIFIMFLLAVLYYLGPNIEQTWRWISPGSVLATILWIAVVFGFKLYLQFSNPGSAYGALGSVVVLLFFLYLTGIVFVLGAELNAILGRRFDPETVKDLADNPQKAESPQAHAEARQHERELHRREGRPVADTRPAPADIGAPSRPPRAQRRSLAGAIVSGIGTVLLAAILAVIKRRSERG